MNAPNYLLLVCSISFFGYGLSCLFSPQMVAEFRRYGLEKFRRLTGTLQLIAACGMLAGLFHPWLGGLAAAGITLQMACGLGVRIKIGDPWYRCFPAATYMLLCGWLAVRLL
ncbi:MAG TPA: DoxX family protein [Opitutales bacterium]|nr:DoxX family protein [Opitutales bacterium]